MSPRRLSIALCASFVLFAMGLHAIPGTNPPTEPLSPRLPVPQVSAQAEPRIYVLAEDAPAIPVLARYDEQISLADVDSVFLPDAQPERRALMVSAQFMDAIQTPIGQESSPEYNALYSVLANSHLVFALDRNPGAIATSSAPCLPCPPAAECLRGSSLGPSKSPALASTTGIPILKSRPPRIAVGARSLSPAPSQLTSSLPLPTTILAPFSPTRLRPRTGPSTANSQGTFLMELSPRITSWSKATARARRSRATFCQPDMKSLS